MTQNPQAIVDAGQFRGEVVIRLSIHPAGWRLTITSENDRRGDALIEGLFDREDFMRTVLRNWSAYVWFQLKADGTALVVQGFPCEQFPTCGTCRGTGRYVGLLRIEDCDDCEGTGLDLQKLGVARAEVFDCRR